MLRRSRYRKIEAAFVVGVLYRAVPFLPLCLVFVDLGYRSFVHVLRTHVCTHVSNMHARAYLTQPRTRAYI